MKPLNKPIVKLWRFLFVRSPESLLMPEDIDTNVLELRNESFSGSGSKSVEILPNHKQKTRHEKMSKLESKISYEDSQVAMQTSMLRVSILRTPHFNHLRS
jgi:hypothetical protein